MLEVVDQTRELWTTEKPLFVRISATDWAEGGWSPEDSIRLAAILKKKDVDLIDCSSGGNVHYQEIPLSPGYQVQFSAAIRKETGILTGAVGLITEAVQAEKILQAGDADLIILARELLRDPYFPLRAAFELDDDITWPDQYVRAKPRKKII